MEQEDAPTPEYVPASQIWQVPVASLEKVPGEHAEQDVDPGKE